MLQKVNLHATDKKLERKKKNCSLLFTLACLIFSRPPQQTPSNSPEASADCATYSATELKMMKRTISQGVYIYILYTVSVCSDETYATEVKSHHSVDCVSF